MVPQHQICWVDIILAMNQGLKRRLLSRNYFDKSRHYYTIFRLKMQEFYLLLRCDVAPKMIFLCIPNGTRRGKGDIVRDREMHRIGF